MSVVDFKQVQELKKAAEDHADMMVPLLQASIPADLRVPDADLWKFLFDSSYETSLYFFKKDQGNDGRD